MDWNKLKQPTFIIAVLFSFKLILQPLGIDIPDQQLNAFANGISALVTIIGIFMDHTPKAKTPDQPKQNDTSAPV
ncbi:hypothetical protein SD70_27125 [Gordoniibacillus kamchatkensis]|uniref:Holin n=1 Tax=Gordoniibacillus kamchatkensis TaxID=1590651 RepID=A0ABR5AD27_9BACL|nr:hypothetical protein [Paenibacillus sp. VKM B-2647]KIL38292.1 hypothetical protein SD70_27125 [Paenibacillus sp. VKM B-2647]